MTLYLIGLGLNIKGISLEGIHALRKCKKIFLESYTVRFPYPKRDLEEILRKKVFSADRSFVESDKLIKLAKSRDIALLIYGSPLAATTHLSLIEDAQQMKVKVKIIDSSSVFTSCAKTGLQLYKFGKTISLPKWDENKNYMPDSFVEVIKENMKINAHTLILADIELNFENAVNQLKEAFKKNKIKINKLKKIIVCSQLGTKYEKIVYGDVNKLINKRIKTPFCIILAGKLHFKEEETLKRFEV